MSFSANGYTWMWQFSSVINEWFLRVIPDGRLTENPLYVANYIPELKRLMVWDCTHGEPPQDGSVPRIVYDVDREITKLCELNELIPAILAISRCAT